MDVFGVISMFGGLALFLYGMSLLGTGLERASGGRLEQTLEKLTDTVLKGVLLGALVTAAIQSSSATTVIVVGLVNAKVLKLRNAIGVIMGANIGTTVTAHILRLSSSESTGFVMALLKPATIAPLALIIGVLLFLSSKTDRRHDAGQILLGFGILFTGMFTMEAAVKPLAGSPAFSAAFAAFGEIPLLGVLVGAVVTAVIQSSSASVGILQALTTTGQITFAMAFPIIMGQNIGTCITPVLASIGASKNAKRSACVHVTFNVIGTILFFIAGYSIQSIHPLPFWNLPIDKGGIANFHTVFNVAVTLMFIPLVGLLEKIACTIVKDRDHEAETEGTSSFVLDDRLLVSPGLAVEHTREAVVRMGELARRNFISAVDLMKQYDEKEFERINENEDLVDKLEDSVETYLLKLSHRELSESDSRSVSELLRTCGEFERMADHAMNVAESAQKLKKSKSEFSKKAAEQMNAISEAVIEIMDLAIDAFKTRNFTAAGNIEPLEEVIDIMEQTLKDRHIERLRKGKCTVDAAFPFVETLSDMERIADHCSNVGVSVLTYDREQNVIDRHDYVHKLHKGQTENYLDKYTVYSTKYISRIKK